MKKNEWTEVSRKLRLDKMEVHDDTRGNVYLVAHWEVQQFKDNKSSIEHRVIQEPTPPMYAEDMLAENSAAITFGKLALIILRTLESDYYSFLAKSNIPEKYFRDTIRT